MTKFEALFGIKASQVQKNCILMPMLPKGILNDFRINKLNRGRIYGAGNSDSLTLIHTLIGPAFTGDAVLWLKETKCENIILFGACGGVQETKDLTVGSLVAPKKCFSNESFADFLKTHSMAKCFSADKIIFSKLINAAAAKEVNCSSIPSLKLEESMTKIFIKNKIDVVDMECSACFAAAKHTGLKAAALFYVSDVINKYSFYRPLSADRKEKLTSAIKTAASALCKLTKTNLSA